MKQCECKEKYTDLMPQRGVLKVATRWCIERMQLGLLCFIRQRRKRSRLTDRLILIFVYDDPHALCVHRLVALAKEIQNPWVAALKVSRSPVNFK